MTTLTQYLHALQAQQTQAESIQPVTEVINTIATVGKDITQLLRKGALADILGEVGTENVQGEQQKKLDVIANDLLLDALTANTHCAGVASEELDHATAAHKEGSLLVLFDPLDGSSNIDINMPTGTIFSILSHTKPGQVAEDGDFLQKGTAQLASGYLLYASSVILTFTLASELAQQVGIDDGVLMFSLDPENGEFVLINKNIRIAEDTQEYAINGSNYRHWLPPMQQYVDELLAGKTGPRGKNFNTRWVAAMVGDVHRILCRGGIFIYPKDTKDPTKAGKLRLMYEANPMSLLIERAGGASTDATKRIMDYEPTSIHQRIPVVLGSKNEVMHVQQLHQDS